MNEIPILTKAIADHGYLSLGDLSNAILDAEERNAVLENALLNMLLLAMERIGPECKKMEAWIMARDLITRPK